jgi:hypothetical protein
MQGLVAVQLTNNIVFCVASSRKHVASDDVLTHLIEFCYCKEGALIALLG